MESKDGLDYICIWLGSDGWVVLVDCKVMINEWMDVWTEESIEG